MKIKISVHEKVTYDHEITVEVPEDFNLDAVLDKAEKSNNFDNVHYILEEAGCKVLDICHDDSGMDIEIEIPEYDEVEDDESKE
jgi:hypothetical protein